MAYYDNPYPVYPDTYINPSTIGKSTALAKKLAETGGNITESLYKNATLPTTEQLNQYFEDLNNAENEEEKQKVSEAERSKLDFLRAASHELKTPVTALNAILENIILGVGKYKDRDTYLVQCKEITTQLSSMIKEVLDASKIDFVMEQQNAEPFDLSEELPAFCEPYCLIAKAKQIEFLLNTEGSCPVLLPKKGLEKILSNLLSNAVSYTPSGHGIQVTLQSDKLIIENECKPIPPDKLPRLFEPFYRPDFARDRKDGGNGLGLYIVDTLSKALHLHYTFIPMTSPDGMQFILYF